MARRLYFEVIFLALFILGFNGSARAQGFEVWVLDQGANRLQIFGAPGLESQKPQEVIDLAPNGGMKPHMIYFSPAYDYAFIANVASGHVYVMRTSDKKIVFNEDLGQQAHAAIASPDGKRSLVANQNDKKLTEILTNYKTGDFRVGRVLDLEASPELGDAAEFPDRAPICLMFTADGSKAYVTLRGGGLAVVSFPDDPKVSAKIVKAYGRVKDGIDPDGCGTIRSRDGRRIYANSGNLQGGKFYSFDSIRDVLIRSASLSQTGRDAHGVAVVGSFIWIANRLDDNIAVLDLNGDVVGTIDTIGDAPDLLEVSPSGDQVFGTLRGPNPATGTHERAGQTPGVTVIKVLEGGRSGKVEFILPVGERGPESKSDPHGIAVRRR